jgi:putative hydrolase of the HAD superfamily
VKVIIFDLGGTLMEFKGMPNSWVDYYKTAFTAIKNSGSTWSMVGSDTQNA